jgi:hypothetical protein
MMASAMAITGEVYLFAVFKIQATIVLPRVEEQHNIFAGQQAASALPLKWQKV